MATVITATTASWRADIGATADHSDDAARALTTSSSSSTDDMEKDDNFFVFVLFQITVPVLFGTIAIVGATGNALVIYVILSRERMRSVTNLLLLNLAIADLAFVVVVPPFTAYQYVASYWPFGDIACRLMHYLVNVTAYVTVYTLVVVAGMRYLTVVHATSTAQFRTRRTTVCLIAGLWAIMSTANVPVLMSYATKKVSPSYEADTIGEGEADAEAGDQDLVPDCDLIDDTIGKPLFGTFFAFGYLVPLSLIALLSIRIVADIRRQRATASAGVRRVRSLRSKKPVGRTLVLVVGLFAALWLPIHLHLLIWFFCGPTEARWYQVISVLWNCLAYSNSCVNPIVYNHTSKDFRDSFRAVILATFRRHRSAASGSSASCASDRRRQHHRQLCEDLNHDSPSPDMNETIANHGVLLTPPMADGPAAATRLSFPVDAPPTVSLRQIDDDGNTTMMNVNVVVFCGPSFNDGIASPSDRDIRCKLSRRPPEYVSLTQTGNGGGSRRGASGDETTGYVNGGSIA